MFQACVIFGSVTIFGIVSWYLTPEEKMAAEGAAIKRFREYRLSGG